MFYLCCSLDKGYRYVLPDPADIDIMFQFTITALVLYNPLRRIVRDVNAYLFAVDEFLHRLIRKYFIDLFERGLCRRRQPELALDDTDKN